MTRKLTTAITFALVAVVIASQPAHAADFAMSVTVENPQITVNGGPSGNCDWEVVSRVRVVNLTDGPISLSAVDSFADYTGSTNGHVSAAITNDASLAAGAELAAESIVTYYPVITRFTIPCSAPDGQVEFRLVSSVGTGSGDAPFIEGGTPVPMVTILGAVGILGALVIGFALRQRRRPAPVQA